MAQIMFQMRVELPLRVTEVSSLSLPEQYVAPFVPTVAQVAASDLARTKQKCSRV
jgi:hypothetical protein